MPDLSSRLKATRWPPASSTATVSGARLVSRAFFSATSTMVEACESETTDMTAPMGWLKKYTSGFGAARPIDRLLGAVPPAEPFLVGFLEGRQRRFGRRHVG